MTTPAGVPNLPIGALTVETLGQQLQDQTAAAMRARAGERVPNIFNSSTGGDILNDLSPFGIITNIWAGINSLIANSDPSDIQGPEDLPPLLMDFIEGLPFVGQFVTLLQALVGTYDGEDETLLSIQELLSPIIEFFSGLIEEFGTLADWVASIASGGLSAVMQALETFFTGIPNLETWLARLKTLIDGLAGITSFSAWVGVFKEVIDFFLGIGSRSAWLTAFKSVIDTFKALFDSLGSKVWTVLTEMVTHFSGLFTSAGDVTAWLVSLPANLISVIEKILGGNVILTSLSDGLTKLTAWTQSVPNLEGLIQGILHPWVNPLTQTNNTLVDLQAWATKLLTSTSVIPSFNLNGVIPPELLALIGVGQIGDVAPNLITDAGFGSQAAFQAGVGWSWDNSLNSAGSTGGAAKLLCDGGVKYLFSNLIAVAPLQKLTVSVKTRYTKGSTAQANIICGVRTYNGETVKATTTVAQVAATGTTSVGISGADAAGFKKISGDFTIPADTTHVRLVLGVTTGTSGTTIWFDDASLTKTSLLAQDLVQNLGSTIEALLPVNDFNALLNEVAGSTGATIQQVKDVIDGKLQPGDVINGGWISVGDISSEVISELRDTWTRLGGSVTGGTGSAPTSLTGAAAEFASLVSNINSLVSLVGGNIGDIFRLGQTVSGHTTLISGIDSKLQTYSAANNPQVKTLNDQNIETARQLAALAVRTAALELKTSTTPPPSTVIPITTPPVVTPVPPTTPTPAPPVLVSATDDFERSALGSNWVLTKSNENGSNVGIINSHDAYMSVPGLSTTTCRIAAIYAGPGSASSGDYQKIWATLGSKAGIPAVGTQGFNDLIGRAASATQCIFVRVFPDGRVQFGYRQGSWTDQIFGSFNTPKALTSATPIEFYVGNKSINDQTKVYAMIGGNTIGPSTINTAVLATMGKGWGFGMGHGLSDGTFTFGNGVPQSPGVLNFWSAQEQA